MAEQKTEEITVDIIDRYTGEILGCIDVHKAPSSKTVYVYAQIAKPYTPPPHPSLKAFNSVFSQTKEVT